MHQISFKISLKMQKRRVGTMNVYKTFPLDRAVLWSH